MAKKKTTKRKTTVNLRQEEEKIDKELQKSGFTHSKIVGIIVFIIGVLLVLFNLAGVLMAVVGIVLIYFGLKMLGYNIKL